jgi:ADP-ribose pyrophosphatase YjhB (NUDIX family)
VALPLRNAVRAVVLDDADRLLLVRFSFAHGPVWATPGGGIEPGETHDVAIRRELHEEVGLTDVTVGPAVWTRTHRSSLLAGFSGQRETYYFIRVHEAGGPPAFSAELLRAEGLTGSRWWTGAELSGARKERFAPRRLPELYAALVADGPPVDLIDTGE